MEVVKQIKVVLHDVSEAQISEEDKEALINNSFDRAIKMHSEGYREGELIECVDNQQFCGWWWVNTISDNS